MPMCYLEEPLLTLFSLRHQARCLESLDLNGPPGPSETFGAHHQIVCARPETHLAVEWPEASADDTGQS